jgi:hypothetical protein
MQVIEILSLTGHSPYDITICDITKTYCYVVATGVVSVPITVNVPTELLGTQELLTVITDNAGCETFQPYYCFTPTPTPTHTPTPTITPTNISCNCITFTNTITHTVNYGFTDCNNVINSYTIESGTTLYVCGKLPFADRGVDYTIGDPCFKNTCILPTPTPTQTSTNTPTPTHTPTNTPTHTINCVSPILNSVQLISGSLFGMLFTSSYGCTSIIFDYSRDNLTWTSESGSCISPRTLDTGDGTGVWYFRIRQICNSITTTGNTITYVVPTPTPTPTHTPTPTYPYVFDPYVYLVPEPQDTTSLTNLGTYMYNSGSTSFLGWGNGGVPSISSYSHDLNIYIHYSGFTGGSGNFVTNVSTLKGYIRQLSGTGTDTFGCSQNQYTFNTIKLNPSQVNDGIQYFYTLWVPLNSVGGTMSNMTVDIGSSLPCSTGIVYNSIPDSVLSGINVTVSSGAAIPSNVYRVLWIDPTCLLPSTVPPPSLSSPLFFKGNTKT